MPARDHKSTAEAPAWLKSKGLDAYEYEAGRGITAKPEVLSAIGEAARAEGILMSFHTPYFISLSGTDPEKRLKSIDYITKSLDAATLPRRGHHRHSQRQRGQNLPRGSHAPVLRHA